MFRTVIALAALVSATWPALAGEADFHGRWEIKSVVIGPWHDPSQPLPDHDTGPQVGQVVEIAKGRMTGPKLLDCAPVELQTGTVPYLGMFEGGLAVETGNKPSADEVATARRHAEALGFTAEPVEELTHSCSEISLFRVNATTLVFGLDYRIFTLGKP
ncbi:MAG: hypothetical protein KL863_06975 [Rhizobium sp.]|nr:hypothetical protein [Rhizobium sp.]